MTTAPAAWVADIIIVLSALVGLVYAAFNYYLTARITLGRPRHQGQLQTLALDVQEARPIMNDSQETDKVAEITEAIASGAKAFLFQMYKYMSVFIVVFAAIIFFAISSTQSDADPTGKHFNNWKAGGFSTIAFVLGSITSIISGYIGMSISTVANGRVALEARKGYAEAFATAFRAGTVMGFALCSLALFVLWVTIALFSLAFNNGTTEDIKMLYECITGYGLGGSSIALFNRVGGGIYTKAADVGADLVGKVEVGIPEDDPRNPAVIADNVGDNVGDIAGMGADLFGSFAESTCAALVIAATSKTPALTLEWSRMMFPLLISASGILVGVVTSFVATNLRKVRSQSDIEPNLKLQLVISTILETGIVVPLAYAFLPNEGPFVIVAAVFGPDNVIIANSVSTVWWKVLICVICGLWSGLLIGFTTEYYTSHSYRPVREVSDACKTGAATNIIFGLALGYLSVIIPVTALSLTIYISFLMANMFGIAMGALGILSTLTIGLTIDAYGPISDNAGGIAEMSGLGPDVRERTDALDAAGNTTAAIGKGFAIGSAALVSIALWGGFLTRAGIKHVDLLDPFTFAGLLMGAMLPYWFSAFTMKSVGKAANQMVEEVRRQFREIPGLLEGTNKPDYQRCVRISTDASLREMIAPGALVMLTPLLVGIIIGPKTLAGVLAGALVSGVQMAISSSNTGGAWDNAKKYIESGMLGGKGSDAHKAAVVGDTVGDPLKDTSGPSLNILIKLMAVESLVFQPFFALTGWLEKQSALNPSFDPTN